MYSYVASKAVEDSTFSVSEIKRMDRFDRFDGTSHVQISAKHLIEGLLPLIISTAHASTSLSSNGINLINENDAGRLLLARCHSVIMSDLHLPGGDPGGGCKKFWIQNPDQNSDHMLGENGSKMLQVVHTVST